MENVQEFVNNQNSVAAEKNETTSSTKTSFLKKLLGRNDVGTGRFFKNQTYHHAVLRALSQVATHGADISEVLQANDKDAGRRRTELVCRVDRAWRALSPYCNCTQVALSPGN
jgi:hypothetical protein